MEAEATQEAASPDKREQKEETKSSLDEEVASLDKGEQKEEAKSSFDEEAASLDKGEQKEKAQSSLDEEVASPDKGEQNEKTERSPAATAKQKIPVDTASPQVPHMTIGVVVVALLLYWLLFQHGDKKSYDDYAFTVNVDDLYTIAKMKRIDIEPKAKADTSLLDTEKQLRVVGFVGHKDSGKSWLINTLFGTNLATGREKTIEQHGLAMTYGGDSWLVVHMMGSEQNVKSSAENYEKRAANQHLLEAFRYILMDELCHAIVFVVSDVRYRPYGRLATMIERTSERSFEDKPLLLVAMINKTATTQDELRSLRQSWKDVLVDVTSGMQLATTNDIEGSSTKFSAMLPGKYADVAVPHFGFGARHSEGLNAGMKGELMNKLKETIKTPQTLNVLSKFKEAVENNLHLLLDGKSKKETNYTAFKKDDLRTVLAKEGGKYVLKITNPENLTVKEVDGQFKAQLQIQDEGIPIKPKLINQKVTDDFVNQRKIWNLYYELPGIAPADCTVQVENGKYFLKYTQRSRRPQDKLIRPFPGSTAIFKHGTHRMMLPFGQGWEFNMGDKKARELVDGVYKFTAYQSY